MKKRPFDLIQTQKWGRLIVLKEVHRKKRHFKCRCECGKIIIVSFNNLVQGHTKSCGCLRKERSTRHGIYNKSQRLYNIWTQMIHRCYNEDSISYPNYGKRGIRVCSQWVADIKEFYNWAITNGYKEDLWIDRIDNNGNYEPSNCRWVTPQISGQNRNDNKLNEQNIKIIRDMLKRNFLQKEIADKFNIDQSMVSYIKNNKRWGNILTERVG